MRPWLIVIRVCEGACFIKREDDQGAMVTLTYRRQGLDNSSKASHIPTDAS